MEKRFKKVHWPGWSLDTNPFGEEFDEAARKRMVVGSRMLYPFLRKYQKKIGNTILEIGPFFNPLITPQTFPHATIVYWDNDTHVTHYLNTTYHNNVSAYPYNLNNIQSNTHNLSFDAIIISHVLNYVDYTQFLRAIKEYSKKGGLLFINNVVNYGLPALFSEKRAKSIQETMKTVKEIGYTLVEKKSYESPDKKYQKNKRLILVLKKE